MAKKIKFNKINGKDTLANSVTTLNQNFKLIEDTLQNEIAHGVSSLQIEDVRWNTSGANGPSATIRLTNGNTAKINAIPSADESQSGVVTVGDQTIAGRKTFKDGILVDYITDKEGKDIVVVDGNTVYVGGNGGIKLVYDNNGDLTDVEYGFLKGVDLTQIINDTNNSTRTVEEMREYLEMVLNDYNERLESQEDEMSTISTNIAELNLHDLAEQIDEMVENYFGSSEEMEELRSEWAASNTLENHVGDTFTDIDNRLCYKFRKTGIAPNPVSYRWEQLDPDEYSVEIEALLGAINAKSIADGKCTTYYKREIPAPCYVGDTWIVKDWSFYMKNDNNGNRVQTEYIEGTTEVSEGTIIYSENTMLFCIRNNDTDVPNIEDWNKDMTTWSEIQFKKNVDTRFNATNSAVEKAQGDIDALNDDDVFSVFEKRDFLNNTWYLIAGSYTYDPSVDVTYQDGKPTQEPTTGFLGTTAGGSFWNAVSTIIGDNTQISEYNTPLGELITAFKALATFCRSNGLFASQLESTTFVTTRSVGQDKTVGAVAKQELSDLLYNYYREEEECKQSAFVSSVTTTIEDLSHQLDKSIQNWYINDPNNHPPTTQATLPWRQQNENQADYTTNDEKHIDDTAVDLVSALGQSVYKFAKRANQNDNIGTNDVAVTGTDFYWKSIQKSDVSTIIDTLHIDSYVASLDGLVNIFNTTPHNYSYGDIWFFNGFTQAELNSFAQQNPPVDVSGFIEGCIYYCMNTELTGLVNPNDPNGGRFIRENLVVSDWTDGYEKGNEFIAKFANMASDSCLTPIEKSQLVRTFYEISGTDLCGNDGNASDNIIEDIFTDDASNDGSLRFVIVDCIDTLNPRTPSQQQVSDYSRYTSFMGGNYEQGSTNDNAKTIIGNLVNKFKDIENALKICGCLTATVNPNGENMSTDTNLTTLTYSGFIVSTKYNRAWDSTVHVSMLSDLFTTYYMEEDNLKTFVQQFKVDDLDRKLSADISAVSGVANAAQSAAARAETAIGEINNDNTFSVFEKRDFLNNTWYAIAGSYTYSTSPDVQYQEYVDGNTIKWKPTTMPPTSFLGTTESGSFWDAVKNIKGDNTDAQINNFNEPLGELITAFKALAHFCSENGLFAASLSSTTFVTINRQGQVAQDYSNIGAVAKNELADLLYNYYREEEECRKHAYVYAVSTTIDDLSRQIDKKIQNWYINDQNGVPTTQATLPWRETGEITSNYTTNDEKHVDDTAVDLSSTLGQSVYKFSKYTNTNEVNTPDDKFIKDANNENTGFYWKSIQQSDTAMIIDQLGIDSYVASLDGLVNIFNTTPHNYGYGDIWFFNGFEDDTQWHGHLTPQQKANFVEGCIYYCGNKDLTGEGSDTIREYLLPSDWTDGYEKGNEFIAKFANMASDHFLTPIEKSQLVMAFYEISGTGLETNNIIQHIFNNNNNTKNDGSFRSTIFDCINTLLLSEQNGTAITNYTGYNSFMQGNYEQGSSKANAVTIIGNLVAKFNDIVNVLKTCGCLTATANPNGENLSTDTDLSTLTFSGLSNNTYNGSWSANHVSMLSDLFTTYYMEEDNIKTFTESFKVDDLGEKLTTDINGVRTAANAANTAINAINSDRVFSISEKLSFLNNTWYKIAGSKVYTYNATTTDQNTGKPVAGYLGTTSKGSFWSYIENMDVRPTNNQYPSIVQKFRALGAMCDHFGLFAATLVDTEFGASGSNYTADDFYDTIFQYYNEEELLDKQSYAASLTALSNDLRNQIDGKINTFYNTSTPPNNASDLNALVENWSTNPNKHINDVYKDTTNGKTYVFTEVTQTETPGSDDVTITGINYQSKSYFWKLVESTNIDEIISQFEDAFDEAMATVDGIITVFAAQELPENYGYGDIWFFGGTNALPQGTSQSIITSITNSTTPKFVEGNVYYCNATNSDSSDGKFDTFSPSNWTIGSNSGEMTAKFTHMTSDNWLSVKEKQELLDTWFEITGITFPTSSSVNVSNILTTIEDSNNENGSYKKLLGKYNEFGDSPSGDQLTAKTNLDNALKDIFVILKACGCKSATLTDSDLSDTYIPPHGDNSDTLNGSYGTGTFASNPTIISNIFNNYYAKEKDFEVKYTDYRAVNTVDRVIRTEQTMSDLASGVGGKGFVLSSLIELQYDTDNNGTYETVGGLNGTPASDIGLWLGGTDTQAQNHSVPVYLTKSGYGSKIGPFKVGGSSANEHIYVGDSSSGNVTVIGTDYISMGATYANSDTKNEASTNAPIFLDRGGVGSKIGPLTVGSGLIHIGNNAAGTANVTVIGTDYISMGATLANSDTKNEAKSNSIIYLDKDGNGSKIGVFNVDEATVGNETCKHVYIGNKTSGNVTVIADSYISLGTTYEYSKAKQVAETHATIFLDKEGEGSRIGPLKIDKSGDDKILTFGNSKTVYKFNNPNSNFLNIGYRAVDRIDSSTNYTETTIDGHIFYGSNGSYSTELNTMIQYSGDSAISDFSTIPQPGADDETPEAPVIPNGN